MDYPTTKGLLTELACQQAFTEIGIVLSQPITVNSRYDFIADINGILYKIQCKTSRWLDQEQTAIVFPVSTKNCNTNERHSYKSQVDFFFTTFEEENYLIPIDDVGVSHKTLRFTSKLPESNISWASDYNFLKVINNLGYDIPDFVYNDKRDKSFFEKRREKLETGKKLCIDCKTEISASAIRCVDCYKKIKRKCSINVERDELKMKIRIYPFTEIGKQYNVTDNAIRKWCDKYDLPRKKSDINKISDEEWALI